MYTAIQITSTLFLKKLFPEFAITAETEQKIKKIIFFGNENTKGFILRAANVFKKIRENKILLPETKQLGTEIILTDEEAKAANHGDF